MDMKMENNNSLQNDCINVKRNRMKKDTEVIYLRVSKEIKSTVELAAKKLGISVNDWFKVVIMSGVKKK